jgi:DNA replication protein DnaC
MVTSLGTILKKMKPSNIDDEKIEKRWQEFLERKKTIAIDLNMDYSGIPSLTEPKTLNKISPRNNQQKLFIEGLLKWEYKKDYRLPYLYGPPGTGKSYISTRMAYSLISKGFELENFKKQKYIASVKFVNMSEFLLKARNFFEDKGDALRKIFDSNVLVLDDFCSHASSPIVGEILHAILDNCLRNKKPTLITSNVPASEISSFLSQSSKGLIPLTLCNAIKDRVFELCSLSNFRFESFRTVDALKRIKKAQA